MDEKQKSSCENNKRDSAFYDSFNSRRDNVSLDDIAEYDSDDDSEYDNVCVSQNLSKEDKKEILAFIKRQVEKAVNFELDERIRKIIENEFEKF
jgi:DNA-directed RNA polymerase specialized sigma subunit